MRNFLNQVRGRKITMKIARYFTSDIPALVQQLKKIEENYYKGERRSREIDEDIVFIRRLYGRIESRGSRSASNDDGFVEECHNEVASQARSPEGDRKKQVLPSTSVNKRVSNKAAKKQSNKPQGTGSNGQSVFASTSSGTQTSVKPTKKESTVQGTEGLSPGVRDIILKTGGHLRSKTICEFLKAMRGKNDAVEVAYLFTSDISSLVSQLRKVVEIYSKQKQKDKWMDRDIRFIQTLIRILCDHLESERSEAVEIYI